MKSLDKKNLPGVLAGFLVLFCLETCTGQDGGLRPKPSPLHPRPTSSPVHRFRTLSSRSRGIRHLPSSAAPDRHLRSAYSRDIRPSATRDPIRRSRGIRSSVLPEYGPKPSRLHPRPTVSPAHIFPTRSSRTRDVRRLPSSAKPIRPFRSAYSRDIRPSASRESRAIRPSVSPDGCKDASLCGPTKRPSTSTPKNPKSDSKCFILKPGKPITEYIPLRKGLVAVIVGPQYQGIWQYSSNNNNWRRISTCRPGQVLVLSVRYSLRFQPNAAFHGVVKFRAAEFKRDARVGSCVSMTAKPSVEYNVALVVPPMVVPFILGKVTSKIEIKEDEIDKKGKQISELFAVRNRTRLAVDHAALDCIPADIKKHYLALIKEVNENSRPAVAVVKPPEKGRIEYRYNRSDPWKFISISVRDSSRIHSIPFPLNAFVRFVPSPNANGKTLIKLVASALVSRADPVGFSDLRPCVRDFLTEMAEKKYVYEGLLNVVYKAFQKTKQTGTVTIDGLISTLQEIGRSADRESLTDVRRAREILEKVKNICDGRLNKAAFFKWYDKTITPYVKKSPCEKMYGSMKCLYAGRPIELPIHILPVDDQPIIQEPRVYFPPIPNRLNSTYEDGVPVFMLMNADQSVVRKLIFGNRNDKLRDIMAKGLNPDSLIAQLPKREQWTARYQKRKCAIDNDGDELGMAILGSSPSIRNETLGRWVFKKKGASSWEPIKKGFRDLRQDKRSCKPMALVKPGDRLKFEPRNKSLLWNNVDAQELTRLDFHAWEGKDNRTSGVQCVDFNASSARFSNTTSSIIVTRLGCNDKPGSMAIHDSCGVCGGNNDCVGCDGVANSDAKEACGICYGGKTGVPKPKLDCAGRCNTSFVDECGQCQSWHKRKRNFKDCAGTCRGTRGYGARENKCKVCVGGVTGKPINSGMDVCGECGGDNSTCTDCKGIVKGPNMRDYCNNCLDPKSPDFNRCEQIISVSLVTLPASGPSYVTCKATGVKTARSASCVLQKGAERISLQKTNVVLAPKTGVSSFYLQIKTVAAGSYSLKCLIKFDSSSKELEFTKQKLFFYDDESVNISSVEPGFALRNKATNVTLIGSGFMNRTTAKCVLEITTPLRPQIKAKLVVLKATFVSSSKIRCLVPPRWETGEFKLGVVFSGSFVGMKKTSFAIKSYAPLPVSCQWSKNLKKLMITFDQPAAPLTRSVNCSRLQLFSPLSARRIGTKAKCHFRSRILQVTLPVDAPFTKSGRTLTLEYRKLKNAFAKLTHYRVGISEVSVNCSRPTKLTPITVEIRGAKSAGPCQRFKIRAKATGSGKLSYTWSAFFSNKTKGVSARHQENMRKLKEFLSRKNEKFLAIGQGYVLPNVTYEVRVTVKDAFKQQREAVVSLTRDNGNAPRVFIAGPKQRKVSVNRRLRLRAFVVGSSSVCQRSARKKVLYTWTCSSSSIEMKEDYLRILDIKRKQFRPGKQYKFEVVACLQGQCSRASVILVTESRPLQSKIKGGDKRSIGEHDPLTLDGRASLDPDADTRQMKYRWSCEDPDGYTCYYPNKTNPSELIRLDIPDKPVVHIDTTEQLPPSNGTYKFTLTVSKGNRSSTTETKIKVERGSPPETKFFDIKKANPDKKIAVRCQLKSKAPVTQYEFSIVEESKEGFAYVNLEEDKDVVKSKIRGEVKRSDPRKPARKTVALVFNPGKLSGNATYRIRFTATYDNTTSYAEIDLKTKAQPSEGEVLIEPSEGVAANTSFTISAGDGWTVDEEDGPLVYRCGCLLTDRRGRKQPKYFVEFSEKDSCETTLPVGDKATNHSLKCFIEACDVHGSCTKAEQDVTVLPKKFEADDVAKVKEQALELFDEGHSSSAGNVIGQLLLSSNDKGGSDGGEEDKDLKEAIQDIAKTGISKGMDSIENGETQSEDQKDQQMTMFSTLLGVLSEDLLKEIRSRLSNNLHQLVKPGEGEEQDDSTSRRKRRSVSEPNPEVQEKTPDQVEDTLYSYQKIIQPSNFSNDSMTIKEQFLDTLDELGRSMCKGLSTGESPLAAESTVATLRSEKNSFEHVHINYTSIGCDSCSLFDSNIAEVLLGKSLKELYENWDCGTEDGCNGACVVSAQMSHDLLSRSLNESISRVSDVMYVKLFNPETLVAMTVPALAAPMTFGIPLINVTDAQSSQLKCHKWDASSSSWTTTDVSTNGITTEGSKVSLNCTASHLGFFTVFDLGSTDSSTASTTSRPTTSQGSETTTLSRTTAPPASPTVEASATSNTDQQTEIQFSLDASYDAVINDNNKDTVIAEIRNSIASQLRINKSRISNLSLHSGSIIVHFFLLPSATGQQSVQNVTETFKSLVQNGNFAVTLSNGQRLNVIRTSFLEGSSIPSITPRPPTVTPTDTKELKESGLGKTTLIAIIVAGSLVALMIIAVLVFYCLRKRDQNQKVKAMKEEEDENWEKPGIDKKKDIPMKGIRNEGHQVEEDLMAKGSGTSSDGRK